MCGSTKRLNRETMMKNIVMSVLLLTAAGWAGAVVAGEAKCPLQAAPALKGVSAHNKVCPIMGSTVTDDSPVKVEYMGKIYNLCCGGCKEVFLKDPQAALKKLAAAEASPAAK